MTRPTGKPKGRPTKDPMLGETLERIALGMELGSNDPQERRTIEWVLSAQRRVRSLLSPESEAYALVTRSIVQLESWCAYDDTENARHAQIAAPLQVPMQVTA